MSSYMDFIKEQLYTLTSIPSPSGFTRKATDYLLSELSSLGYSPERSNKGNVFVTLGGSGSPLVLQPMWIPWALWSAPLKITAVFVPQPSEDINGLLQTVKTVPFTHVTAEFTQESY